MFLKFQGEWTKNKHCYMICFAAGTLPGLSVEVQCLLFCWFIALRLPSYLILPQSSSVDLGRPDHVARIYDAFSQGRIRNIQSGKFIFKALFRKLQCSAWALTEGKQCLSMTVQNFHFHYLCNKLAPWNVAFSVH